MAAAEKAAALKAKAEAADARAEAEAKAATEARATTEARAAMEAKAAAETRAAAAEARARASAAGAREAKAEAAAIAKAAKDVAAEEVVAEQADLRPHIAPGAASGGKALLRPQCGASCLELPVELRLPRALAFQAAAEARGRQQARAHVASLQAALAEVSLPIALQRCAHLPLLPWLICPAAHTYSSPFHFDPGTPAARPRRSAAERDAS